MSRLKGEVVFFKDPDVVRTDRDLSPLGHCLSGVLNQIFDHLLHLIFIDIDRKEIFSQGKFTVDIGAVQN